MSAKHAKTLICYKEGRTQKWIMTTANTENDTLTNLYYNPKVDVDSVFMIPVCGLMFGGIWLNPKSHSKSRLDFFNFFEEYNQKPIKINPEIKEISKQLQDDYDDKHKSLYGFISPDGKYYSCEYEGHANLADKICFGQYETNNAERYLEEHGWCKIYKPFNSTKQYAIYVGDKYTLTKEQFNTLKKLGLENAKYINNMLVKE